MSDLIQQAFELANETRKKAYAEYSKFKVGAVIKAKGSDQLFNGNNIEFCVNGASVCAERSAVSNMISALGESDIEWVVVVGDADNITPPCGICRQVLIEFCSSADTPIYMFNPSGKRKDSSIGELLPFFYKNVELKQSK